MADTYDQPPSATAQRAAVEPSLVTTTHVIYALHSLSILIGVTSAATIIGAFVFGLPSIIAVIINYVKRSDVRGTYLESHFGWQIRTVWFARATNGCCARGSTTPGSSGTSIKKRGWKTESKI